MNGNEDEDDVSPTEHGYNCATKHRKNRLIYVWGLMRRNATRRCRS
ncbi:MAG: hypothetical protein WAX69_17055 [Victivallales bacterium]